jgi:hypothetical protein
VGRIFEAGVLVGILDGLFAIALYVVALKATTPVRLFQSIAGAMLVPASFQGGMATAALGLALHFTVAHAWSAAYFLALRASSRPTPVTARSFLPVLIGQMFVVGLPIALVIRPQGADRAQATPA